MEQKRWIKLAVNEEKGAEVLVLVVFVIIFFAFLFYIYYGAY